VSFVVDNSSQRRRPTSNSTSRGSSCGAFCQRRAAQWSGPSASYFPRVIRSACSNCSRSRRSPHACSSPQPGDSQEGGRIVWREGAISRRHDRRSFDWGSPELNHYLHRCARQNHESGGAKTFVAVPPEEAARVLGYYASGPASIETFWLTVCGTSQLSMSIEGAVKPVPIRQIKWRDPRTTKRAGNLPAPGPVIRDRGRLLPRALRFLGLRGRSIPSEKHFLQRAS